MMKTALLFLLIVVAPALAQSPITPAPHASPDEEAARTAAAGVDIAAVKAQIAQSGATSSEADLVAKSLESLQSGATTVASTTPAAVTSDARAQVAALGRHLTAKGVPERLIHPVLWAIQDRRFPRVDPEPLFAQLRQMGLDPSAIKGLTDAKIRVYAKPRTDVAEAQYENLSNSLYIPPDYLEPGANPPRLKAKLSNQELNTVIHELDHAEKDQLADDTEVYGKSLGGALLAGVRKVWIPAVGSGALGLIVSAVVPKLAAYAPVVGLSLLAAITVGGAVYGAYKWYTSRDKNPRTAREQAAKDALDGIADVIRNTPGQKEAPGITEARSKAWEVSGYFMGDSVSDILDQIDQLKLNQLRRIRAAKTPAEVDAVLKNVEVPANLVNRKFGGVSGNDDAYFRNKQVNFPYKDHPELFRKLYQNSLGINPPADVNELVSRINADPTLFPELRDSTKAAADRRLKELEQAPGHTPSSTGAPPPADDRLSPNFTDVPVSR